VGVRAVRQLPAHLLTSLTADGRSGMQRVDSFLTEQARVLSPQATDRVAKHLLHHLDPDAGNRFDPAGWQRRELSASTDSTGMLILRGQLDPAGSAAVRAALDRYGAPTPGTAVDQDGQQVLVPTSAPGPNDRPTPWSRSPARPSPPPATPCPRRPRS
jgi:Domain of unknown function (DUF222)